MIPLTWATAKKPAGVRWGLWLSLAAGVVIGSATVVVLWGQLDWFWTLFLSLSAGFATANISFAVVCRRPWDRARRRGGVGL